MKTSVALCTYNGEKFLREQLDSILNQTKTVDEIVVCDDGSTDSTLEILEEYHQKIPGFFRIFKNEINLRSVKNFEKAISLCENEIIFLCDQDDLWIENKVELITNFFQKNPKTNVVATNGFGIDDTGNKLEVHSLWDIPRFFQEEKIEIDYFKIIAFAGNIATGASMAFRKTFVEKLIPFPIIEGFHHDEWIALNAASNDGFEFLQEKLFKYRIHDQQQVGDVFLPKTLKNRNLLIQHFDFSVHDEKFKSFKFVLKRISKSYKKNNRLSEEKTYYEISRKIKRNLEILYAQKKKRMLELYPVKGRLLNLSDQILNKRKLN